MPAVKFGEGGVVFYTAKVGSKNFYIFKFKFQNSSTPFLALHKTKPCSYC